MNGFEKYTDYKTILTVNTLIWCKGKVLMLKRSDKKQVDPGLYAGIGGKVEPHESFYDAIFREIEEETGIRELEIVRQYSVTQHPYPPTESEWVNLYFIAKIPNQIEIKPNEDGTFHWVDPRDFDKLPMAEDTKTYLNILNENPNAFIFGFFEHDKKGNLTSKTIKII